MVGTRIAILGATSHIARGLMVSFSRRPEYELRLFARSPDRVSAFLKAEAPELRSVPEPIAQFGHEAHDAVINCTGIGDPARLGSDPAQIFSVTEPCDDMILGYLARHPDSVSLHFSSGVVYGTGCSGPINESTLSTVDMNRFALENSYAVAKMNSEAKHRAHPKLNIVDLRVFAYFSRFMDLDARYFIAELVRCLKAGRKFRTGPADMIRDYAHPADLAALVMTVIARRRLNDVFDVYSRQPAGKFEILEHFRKARGLEYHIDHDGMVPSATGTKTAYYSMNRRAKQLGYEPQYSAMDCVIQETEAILNGPGPGAMAMPWPTEAGREA